MTASPTGGRAQRFPEWVRNNVVGLIVTAIVSGVVGYLVNVWLMAVRYEGSVTPEGAPAMSKDNILAGGIFWAMFPMVVCSAIGYRRAVGRERFWRDVRRLPITLVGLFRRDGSHGWVHLLWGAAIALAATLVVPPAVGAVLGAGLLIGAPTIVGSVLSSAFAQLWRLVGRVVAPTKDHRVAPILKVAVGILGWAAAFVIGFVLPGEWTRLVLALGCAAGAFVLGRRTSTAALASGAAALVLGFVALRVLGDAGPVLADDGGFGECGSTLEGWIRSCAGAGEIRRRAVLGLLVAGPFGALGFLAGGFVGIVSAQSPPGAWWDRLGVDDLPRGPIDPATGEALVVNDGRWTEAPVGHVYFEGEWVHPEAVGAVPDLDDDPFTPKPATSTAPAPAPEAATAARDESSARPELWLPPLAAALIAGAAGAGGSESGPSPRSAAGRRARALVAEAAAIHADLEAATTDEERVRLRAALRAKAVEIADARAARQLLAADPGALGDAITRALAERDTEVMGAFVERLNELGMQRGGQPVEAADVDELRERHERHRSSQVAPSNLRQLWKGYGAKKGKFALDAETYLRFLEARRDDPATDEADRATLQRKIDRLQEHVDEGVTTVMVSEDLWNEVAQFAYELATRTDGSGSA